ncbi:MAG: threonine/serine exporter family protein [Treponema sp.]|nr:threonine/serine exporter family protein [Treponema sp.]
MSLKELILAGIWSGGATAFCAIYFNSKKEHAVICGFLGALNWLVYLVVKDFTNNQDVGYFVGTLAVAVASEILAMLLHNPATIFMIPGILPLVPGGGIFYMMRAAVQEDFSVAFQTGYQTVKAAASIALGIAVSASIFRVIHSIIRKCHHK